MQRVQSFEEEGRWVKKMRECELCKQGKFSLVCNFLPLSQETKFSSCGDKFYEGQFLATKKNPYRVQRDSHKCKAKFGTKWFLAYIPKYTPEMQTCMYLRSKCFCR